MAGSADAYLVGGVTYPDDVGEDTKLYKNIEEIQLVHEIKDMEAQLPDGFAKMKKITGAQKALLNRLLESFKKLLDVNYGPLGYLVSTSSEDIVHMYGVDTDEDFCFLTGGSAIMVSNRALNKLIIGGGGRKWMPERGLMISNPEENQINLRMTNDAINEIIAAIEKRSQAS